MKILLVVAQEGYQDLEYNIPKEIFQSQSYEVITASKRRGTCSGKLGGSIIASLSLKEIDLSEFEAILFIGGPGARIFFEDKEVHHLIQEAYHSKKIVAAICIAPLILASAGILKDKKATVWNNDYLGEKFLTRCGARFIDERVVKDGNIITANGPGAAEEFAKTIVKTMEENLHKSK